MFDLISKNKQENTSVIVISEEDVQNMVQEILNVIRKRFPDDTALEEFSCDAELAQD